MCVCVCVCVRVCVCVCVWVTVLIEGTSQSNEKELGQLPPGRWRATLEGLSQGPPPPRVDDLGVRVCVRWPVFDISRAVGPDGLLFLLPLQH